MNLHKFSHPNQSFCVAQNRSLHVCKHKSSYLGYERSKIVSTFHFSSSFAFIFKTSSRRFARREKWLRFIFGFVVRDALRPLAISTDHVSAEFFSPWDSSIGKRSKSPTPRRLFSRLRRLFFLVFHERPIKSIANQVFLLRLLYISFHVRSNFFIIYSVSNSTTDFAKQSSWTSYKIRWIK